MPSALEPQVAAGPDERVPARRPQKWVIEPVRLGFVAKTKELWRYRRMLWFFCVRNVKSRYEGTTLGIFWLFARPLMPIVISTFIFGSLLDVPSHGVPYFLFFLTGVSCWRVLERSLLMVTRSLEQQRGLIRKVYFPRLAAPIAAVAPGVVEFLVILGLFFGAVAFYWWKDGVLYLRLGLPTLLAIPAIALSIVTALAVGLWTAIWQTKHRELKYSIRYGLQLWFFVTPVIYPLSTVPPQYQFLMHLNPMAPVVELYKWSMLGVGAFPGMALLVGTLVMLAILAGGLTYFSRSEAASVDRL
jgi:lipopolysaccharide transport system permease protein